MAGHIFEGTSGVLNPESPKPNNHPTMKALLLSAALCCGLLYPDTANAQDKPGTVAPSSTPTWVPLNVAAMTKDLELDEKTVAVVSDIDARYNKFAESAEKTKITELLKQRDAELENVLSPEQYKKWLSVRDAESQMMAPQPKAVGKKPAKK